MHRLRLWLLARTFLLIGSTSFGGGMMAHFRAHLVRGQRPHRGWLDDDQFLELWALSQALPGLNSTNMAAMVGQRVCGPQGALVAVMALTAPGFLTVCLLASLFFAGCAPLLALLPSVAAAATGLLLANLTQLGGKQLRSAVDVAVAAATFVLIREAGWSLVQVLLVMVPLSMTMHRQPALESGR